MRVTGMVLGAAVAVAGVFAAKPAADRPVKTAEVTVEACGQSWGLTRIPDPTRCGAAGDTALWQDVFEEATAGRVVVRRNVNVLLIPTPDGTDLKVYAYLDGVGRIDVWPTRWTGSGRYAGTLTADGLTPVADRQFPVTVLITVPPAN